MSKEKEKTNKTAIAETHNKTYENVDKVTILGLGLMGAALARLLVENGFQVTVWNRTAEKADELIKTGARLAATPAEAVAASPLSFFIVHDYKAADEILNASGVAAASAGKTFVQLSTGSPKEARSAADWAQRHGAKYLDGAILATPAQMGKPDTPILVSGAREILAENEKVLQTFAGKLIYIGEEIGAANAMDAAALSYTYGAILGFFQGALISESENLPLQLFGQIVKDFSAGIGDFLKDDAERIAREDFTATESTIRISIEATAKLLKTAEESGISTEFPRFVSDIFQRAGAAGLADEEVAALIKLFRKPKNELQRGKNA